MRPGTLALEDLEATEPQADVERAFAALGPDTVAKILFTSGSTGAPKGVINTHRMLCSNQQALGQVWPFLGAEPPVLVDWLPWSHTFGGNHNLGQVLAFGGTLHIDDGKPVPALFDRTVAALRDVSPTVYYNVPAGYALLAPRLEADRALAEAFFSRLRFMFYAAAALPQGLWDRLRALADEVADHEVPLTASWGATETAPGATTAHFASARCGCIGVPLPGVTLKLAPQGDKLELRVRGPNITPGYHRDPATTAAAFDDGGLLPQRRRRPLRRPRRPRPGPALRRPPGRELQAADGHLGHRRPGPHGARLRGPRAHRRGDRRPRPRLCRRARVGEPGRGAPGVRRRPAEDVARDDPRLRAHLAAALARLNAGAGSAGRVERLLLLDEPPSMDAGEITDKGYVNQRAVLEQRAGAVARLFAEPPGDAVILAVDA